MNKKVKLAYVLIMNLPIALAIALTAQLAAIGTIKIPLLCINFVIAYIIAFFIGMFIPVEKLGVGFAGIFKVRPGLVFGLLVNVMINFIYVTLICIVMTFFNVVILMGNPPIAFVGAFFGLYPLIYLVGYIVSFLVNIPSKKVAEKIGGES